MSDPENKDEGANADENQNLMEEDNKPAEPVAAAAASEKALSEKAQSEAAASTKGDENVRTVDDGEMCCCCICHCSQEETKTLSCFGCFPIKCGIVCIGILTLFLILSSFIEIFYMLLNEYIHWWYVLVALLLLVPTIIAASILTAFFNNDTHDRRKSLRCACILVIISFSLLAIWNIFYFQFWYKNADVMFGQPELGYTKQTKKQFVFWSIFLSLTIDAFYAYFICVVSRYKNALAPPAEVEAPKDEANTSRSNDNKV